jgi:membrane associated rhomboid family serine protease
VNSVETCYRHSDRATGVTCSNCGRPICADCMTQTPVGPRCPECSGRTRVQRPGFLMGREPRVTQALIFANLAMYVLTNPNLGLGGSGLFSGTLNQRGTGLTLFGPAVQAGEYYRLISAAFIHYGPAHIAFNMYALYLLGSALERYAGSWRFGVIYLLSALGGSFGALLLSPNAQTAGASGAIFGLMGAMLVLERQRGISLLGGSIGGLLVVNLVITFGIPGISIGGHIGGLIAGAAAGLVLSGFGRGHLAYGRLSPLTGLALVAIGVAAVAGSLAVAGG